LETRWSGLSRAPDTASSPACATASHRRSANCRALDPSLDVFLKTGKTPSKQRDFTMSAKHGEISISPLENHRYTVNMENCMVKFA
jgi:hypothetical protein